MTWTWKKWVTLCYQFYQGRYTWRHNRVLQELAAIISTAKGETTLPNTNALIFTTEGGAKSWHGRPVRTTNQIKCLLDGCDDWDVSADLPEWDSHPSIIREMRLRPDIVIHSASTQQLIMVELTVPYENRMEEAHIYKREKYMNLTKELENAGYKAVVMPVEVGARGFVGSSVYDLLTKLSICGNKRTKALKLLAEIAENSSRWIWSRRNHIYKREKYMNLTKELENAGYKAVVMPVEVGARGFVGSSVYDLLTKLSICGNKRTKALKLLAEIAENSSRWIWSRRNERFLHKD